jgi:hypothetical protein
MTPSPKYQAGKLSSSRSLLVALLCVVGTACSTTAKTEKILFDDPRGTVSLQTIPNPSIQANHPINLEPALLAQLLRGLELHDEGLGREHVKGIQYMIVGAAASTYPLFSEDQVQFLAPLLAEGLRTATPNESIEYRVVTTHEASNRFQSPITETTAGSLYAYGRQLYVILSQYRYNPMLTNLSVRDSSGRQDTVDYSGLKYRTLRLTPKAAQRADSPDPPTMEKSTDRFVAVDYQLLDQAWRALAAQKRAAPQGGQGAAPIGESLEATRAAEAQAPNTAALAQEVETLKKQLESIQKQLGNQPAGQGSQNQKALPQHN